MASAGVTVTPSWHDGPVRRRTLSYLERLQAELDGIRTELHELLDRSSIVNVNPNSPDSDFVFVTAADWGWAPSDAETSAAQVRLLGRYTRWFERFQLLFDHPTPEMTSRLTTADEFVRRWVSRPDAWDHSIPRTIEAAHERADKELRAFDDLLEVASRAGSSVLKLVPDTNALLRNPDLASYARDTPASTFDVHVLPTVVRELDELKDRGRTPELRAQAQSVVRRFKGLRDRGNLADGVALTRQITVRLESREVDAASVLNWLDPTVPDDRIIGAALRLQSDHPASTVLLVTSDLNLQNKADSVGLPYLETPTPTADLQAKFTATLAWRDRTPFVSLFNDGPAVANDVTYSVATPPDDPPPWSKAGPWTIDRLKPGDVDERAVYGIFPARVVIEAVWTDDLGPQTRHWTIEFPERPPEHRSGVGRSR
jgi:rRNA-processing protein FCF1